MCVIAWPGTWGLLFALIKTRPDASHWEMYCVVPTGAGSAFESETVSVGRPITPRRHWQKYVEPIFRFFHNASQIPKAKSSFPKCDATFESCILAQSHWEWERWIYVWHTARLIALKRIGRRLAYSPFAQKTRAAIEEVAEKNETILRMHTIQLLGAQMRKSTFSGPSFLSRPSACRVCAVPRRLCADGIETWHEPVD